MPCYRLCGLRWDCPLPLAGSPLPSSSVTADVIVRLGPVTPPARSLTGGPTWQAGPAGLLLAVPGIGRFQVTFPDRITVDPAIGADWAACARVLTGAPQAALALARGALVLRAAAVVVAGRVHVLCGPAGMGKTAAAGALVAAGAAPWCDDMAVLSGDGAAPVVAPEAGADAPVPVAAIHVLTDGRATMGAAVPAALAAHVLGELLYRRSLAQALDQGDLLPRLSVLAQSVPVLALPRAGTAAALGPWARAVLAGLMAAGAGR